MLAIFRTSKPLTVEPLMLIKLSAIGQMRVAKAFDAFKAAYHIHSGTIDHDVAHASQEGLVMCVDGAVGIAVKNTQSPSGRVPWAATQSEVRS